MFYPLELCPLVSQNCKLNFRYPTMHACGSILSYVSYDGYIVVGFVKVGYAMQCEAIPAGRPRFPEDAARLPLQPTGPDTSRKFTSVVNLAS